MSSLLLTAIFMCPLLIIQPLSGSDIDKEHKNKEFKIFSDVVQHIDISVTITMFYHRPWEKETPPLRKAIITMIVR